MPKDHFGHPITAGAIILVPMKVVHVHDETQDSAVLLLELAHAERGHKPTLHIYSTSAYAAEVQSKDGPEIPIQHTNPITQQVEVIAEELPNPTRFGKVRVTRTSLALMTGAVKEAFDKWWKDSVHVLVVNELPNGGGVENNTIEMLCTSALFDEHAKEDCPTYYVSGVTTPTEATFSFTRA